MPERGKNVLQIRPTTTSFCTILEYNSPKDPYKLWLKYEEEFISDIRWNGQRTHPGAKKEP